jgi:hypothetical protein
MAIAGAATTAYTVSMKDGKVKADKTTILASLCATPQQAMDALKNDDKATVQGSDMWAFWQLVRDAGLKPLL